MPGGKMAELTKEDILNADDLTRKKLNVPEWGGYVWIAVMSGTARDRFETSVIGKNGEANTLNIRAKLAAASLVDESGELLFSEKEIIKLGKKSAAALDLIYEESQKLNRLTDSDVEDLAKN